MATVHDPAFLKKQIALTNPDYVMYVPSQKEYESDNVHLYVVEHKTYGGFLAFWTQSTVEGTGNNHIVMAGSRDGGKSWTKPRYLLGSHARPDDYGVGEAQASWGFPIVTGSGRIYLFYYREVPGYVDFSRQVSAAFACVFSDDCGEHWSESCDISQRLTPYDYRADIQDNIVFQLPMRGPDGKYLAGFTKYASKKIAPELQGGCRVYFYRFDNIDDDPEVKDLKITVLPEDDEGIYVYNSDGSHGNLEEPAWVILPDCSIFCSMRCSLGCVYFSLSSDNGISWSKPRPLSFSDFTPFTHPISPCPLYDLGDGRYIQLYHGVFDPANIWFPRNPLRCAIGRFDPNAKIQPIVFDKKDDGLYMQLDERADALGYHKELSVYGTMTRAGGKNILWYPDRKFFLLGRDVL